MDANRGARHGWTWGWVGGSIWLLALAAGAALSGRPAAALGAIGLFGLAVAGIVALAPWRHPRTRIWKLILPLMAVYLAGLTLGLRLEGATRAQHLRESARLLLVFVPVLGVLGWRRWADMQPGPDAPTPGAARAPG